MRDTFETSGDIRDVDLLAAFVAFWRDRSTGSISFARGGSSAAFQLVEGSVAGVSSTEARFESSAILVRAGKLDAAAIERLGVPEGTDAALAALQAGILTRREWRWGEKIRAIEVLADLLGWPDGKYYFDSDARPQAGDFTLTIPRLVLELFLRSRDQNLIDHQLGPADAPIVRAPDFEREFSTFGLTADAESVVRLIDGHATADEIARSAPADDFAVRKLLAALTTLRLIRADRAEHAGEPEPAPPAAVVPARELDFPAVLEVAADSPSPESEAERAEFQSPSGEVAAVDDEAAAATRAVDLPSMEQPAWEMPELRRPRATSGARTPGFELDPPGSVSALEAYSFPGSESREGRDASGYREPPEREPARDRESEEPVPEEAGPLFESLPPAEAGPGEPPPPRPGSGLGAMLAWVLGGLVVLVAAVVFLRSRSATVTGTSAVPGPTPTSIAAAATSASAPMAAPTDVVVPSPVPTAPPPAIAGPTRAAAVPARPAAPTRVAAATKPTARPAPTRAARVPSPAPTTAPPVREAVSGSRNEWLARAARDEKRLAGEPSVRYAIQLELVCEVPSLVEAWKHDRPAGSMWLLKTRHGTKECFRVLWGRYPNLEAAKAAKSSAPAFFATPSNRPAVVSVR